ncbi:MAG TPA: hypothetical protein VH040_17635 [Usitatibacter sp.]|jgi:hypothetical protein|nr:hypothetical protein [Usitatibacter sp.]
MRRSLLVALATTALSLGAWANDGVELRTKAMASAGAVKMMDAPRVDGPFTTGRDPLTALIQIEARDHLTAPHAACEATAGLCYNAADGRIVYRGARQYMPKLEGLRPESIGMRHNKVVFSYSFR